MPREPKPRGGQAFLNTSTDDRNGAVRWHVDYDRLYKKNPATGIHEQDKAYTPRLTLNISDCSRWINLDFCGLDTAGQIAKLDRLIGQLNKARAVLAKELKDGRD